MYNAIKKGGGGHRTSPGGGQNAKHLCLGIVSNCETASVDATLLQGDLHSKNYINHTRGNGTLTFFCYEDEDSEE